MIDFRKAVSRHVVENPSIQAVPTKKLVQLPRFPRLSRKFIITACILGCAAFAYFFSTGSLSKMLPADLTKNMPFTSEKITETPQYTTVLPAGKKIESLGGWSRVSPPDRNPVFAYADKIDDVQVSVSQQPLPKEFQSDPDKSVGDLAKSYSADEKITIGGNTVYIGTSGKGPQSAIFARDNLLILIKSSEKVSSDQWAGYIKSLQ